MGDLGDPLIAVFIEWIRGMRRVRRGRKRILKAD
jgi:hypothetical protein